MGLSINYLVSKLAIFVSLSALLVEMTFFHEAQWYFLLILWQTLDIDFLPSSKSNKLHLTDCLDIDVNPLLSKMKHGLSNYDVP